MMDTENIQAARRNFKGAAASVPGFQHRPGQQRLVDAIAQTLDAADFSEECTAPAPQVLVAEAGTGTGKTLAYVSAALTVAKAKKVKLVISTATVNLMEQLQNKDLPTLAQSFPGGFTFGLAKGRGRYLCLQKLAHRLESSTQVSLSLDENDAAQLTPDASSTEPIPWYRKLADMIDSQTWNGERDTLPEEASLAEWTGVAADRVSCTGRQCDHFQACPFYQNKRKLVKSDVIVTNHDLLVASLVHGGGALPAPDKAIYVMDEAHHLPAVAMGQSDLASDLSAPHWVGALERACRLAANAGNISARVHPELPARVRERLRDLDRLCRDFLRRDNGLAQVLRFEHGRVHEPINDLAMDLMHACSNWNNQCSGMVDELKAQRGGAGENSKRVDAMFIELAEHSAKLHELLEVLRLFVNDAPAQAAKWLSVKTTKRQEIVKLHVCPLTAAPTLRRFLWSRTRGAILTSATIRTLGSFEYFLREAGLRQVQPRTEVVESPFDYERQGTIIVSRTAANPSASLDRFVDAMAPTLLDDLAGVEHGALALFSSRKMMEHVGGMLPPELKKVVLVQGTRPRDELLRKHRDRVKKGKVSILFGMASFGEGLDLPGQQCEYVFVPKLPFPMPTSPIEEARAEWVEERGGNPFMALTVPATGMLITQWAGRGIRTETDRATIIFYDPRLVEKPYGKQLLAGLPAFARKLRLPNGSVQALA